MALVVSGAGSAVIGLVFWGFATHLVSAATIGRTSAEIAAMTLLAQLSQLSFGSIFERFLPVAGDQTRAFVTRAYTVCVSVALIIAIAYVSSGLGHSFLATLFVWRALFVVAVILWTIFSLQDSVLVGLRATRWVPVENILYSLAKLALLPLLIIATASEGIFIAWLIPVVVMIIVVNWYLFRRRIPSHVALNLSSEGLPSTHELILLAGGQYASLILNVLSGSIVTLIVIDRLGAVTSAHYYIPAQIAGGASILLWSITRSFTVEASTEPDRLRHFARVTLRTMVVALVPTVVIGFIIAPELLGIFGRNYAAQGTTLLRMLLLALPAIAVTSFYCSFALLDKRVWLFAIREFASAVIFFAVFLALIGHFGILSIGIAAMVESGVQGIFFLPILIKRYRQAVDIPVAESGSTTAAS
jgi:O-antigen/teichoic acid export membrane protein